MSKQFVVHIEGRGLAAMDWGGTSDPYYIIYSLGATRTQLCKSETIMRNLSPNWMPQVLYVFENLNESLASQFLLIIL
jgi:hypothetical protein